MAETTDTTDLLGRDAPHELDDVNEPDDAFLFASEQEQSLQAPRRALIVIVTDHPDDTAQDTSRLAGELLAEANFTVDGAVIVRSKKSKIRQAIETGVVGGVDLVLTIGGTGVGPRDKTPEATRAVLDQMVPGIAQALRSSGQACGAVDACTSRGISGVSGSTVIVNVASSRAAVRDGMATLTPLVHHLVDQLQKSSV
ncbi:MogA/MoaB family molybdenum cofactor biosynthesis protein [Corynebacterium minutissimum]|uniref:MogA/MoaB family molybdenum cofactor biosynthesis protein n=1 Tax=unclassified Corynebacterium TaxID=2624378 RepID=UPI0008A58A5A|nr:MULTISPECIES: MogA/MoaB family molybdenum cofactor biosynthesis protein [unclassified Corynebacterium]MDK8764600.1 MogA/MoaB family molybdenum cofactor biosynthesis protein [Corynebacterium sp. MSK218]OFR67301.1 molybdenum cofactor biosynthesis protein [Corynebacterium sp. HMSC078H07]